MGVPGFVAWLYNNHANTNFIFKKLFKTINNDDLNTLRINTAHHLFIDANCLIHPIARKTYMSNLHLLSTNLELLENKIINEIISYIKLIIEQINPTTTIYIAVDGVAPMAKIKHQRMRRFKAIYDKKIMENLCKIHNKEYEKEWNTSAITPGTVFMDNLTKYIISYIKNTKFNSNVIFSSSYTAGEGEHKILQYIRNSNLSLTDNIIVYGLDADLLFLSLSLNRSNIFLMRETTEMELNNKKSVDNVDIFSYLSIDRLGDTIYNITMQHINKSDKVFDKYRIINDFIFLCYFCGNDFIPNIPSLNIKPPNKKIPNGINTIFESYATSMIEINNQTDIIYLLNNNDKISINQLLFLNILKILADDEIAYYTDLYNNRRYIKRSTSTDLFDIDKHNFEENIMNDFKDQVQLGNPKLKLIDWKYNYYKHYYNIKIDKSNLNDNSLNSTIDDYLRGLIWTNYYYFDKCKDYEWYFKHHHGPFVSDIYAYMLRYPERLTIFEDIYSKGIWYNNKIKPLHQLMLVLPHESSYLIPSSYRSLMYGHKLKKYFPNSIIDIQMDYLYKNKGWQNIPMINIIPPNKILQLTSKIILNDDNDRNKLYSVYTKNK